MKSQETRTIEVVKQLLNYLQDLHTMGRRFEMKWEIINTGIVDDPTAENSIFREFLNLEGKNIDINISIKNRSIEEVLTEKYSKK